MEKETQPLTAETVNTVVDALGAVTLCIAQQLTEEQRIGLRNSLARLATNAEKRGDTALESILIDFHRLVSL